MHVVYNIHGPKKILGYWCHNVPSLGFLMVLILPKVMLDMCNAGSGFDSLLLSDELLTSESVYSEFERRQTWLQ